MICAGDLPLTVESPSELMLPGGFKSHEIVFREFHRIYRATLRLHLPIAALLQVCRFPPEAPLLESLQLFSLSRSIGNPTFTAMSLPRLNKLQMYNSCFDGLASLAQPTLTSLELFQCQPSVEFDNIFTLLTGLPSLQQLVLEDSIEEALAIPSKTATLPQLKEIRMVEQHDGVALAQLLSSTRIQKGAHIQLIATGKHLSFLAVPDFLVIQAFGECLRSSPNHMIRPHSIRLSIGPRHAHIDMWMKEQSLDRLISDNGEADWTLSISGAGQRQASRIFISTLLSSVDLTDVSTLLVKHGPHCPLWDRDSPWTSRMRNVRNLCLIQDCADFFTVASKDARIFSALELLEIVAGGFDFNTRPTPHDSRTHFDTLKLCLRNHRVRRLVFVSPVNISREDCDGLVASELVEEAIIEGEPIIRRSVDESIPL
ncbi:hypothetical protein EIP86_001030 [Pleurotus ostreatoroseus]|nr:hypothetical protein EIP86_001030 [Pleurotus ostreatoroseus]